METLAFDEAAGDGPPRLQVLVADDEPGVRKTLQALLAHGPFEVVLAGGGGEALERVGATSFDLVISDIAMPDMDGIELLRRIRGRDLDLPVILLTGLPSLETAMRAVELGAFQYVLKPYDAPALLATAQRAARLCRLARLQRRSARELGLPGSGPRDIAGLESRFDECLGGAVLHYQPIVGAQDGQVRGYEALLRSRCSAIPTPPAVLAAAERLGRLPEVGRAVRALAAAQLADATGPAVVFVNLHPQDLVDPDLFAASAPLTGWACRVVLEITERSTLEQIGDAVAIAAALRALGFRLAVDDLGAGYSGLSNVARLQPEFVKIDMSLVRGVDRDPVRRRIVRSISALARELGSSVVAEGIETEGEADVLRQLPVDLFQGYFFGRPGPWSGDGGGPVP